MNFEFGFEQMNLPLVAELVELRHLCVGCEVRVVLKF